MVIETRAGWRWVAWSVVIGAAAACAWGAETPDPKGKVTFSDSKPGEVRVDVAVPTSLFQRENDFSTRSGSSLDGVGAAPFAPLPNLIPGAVSRRELERRGARSQWILEGGKSLAITEENANRAFGVRSTEPEWSNLGEERPSSFWGAYFGQAEKENRTRARALAESSFKDRSGADSLTRFQPAGMIEAESQTTPFADRQRPGVLFSDSPSQSPALGSMADAIEETRRDLVRDNLNFGFVPAQSDPKADAGAAARAEQFRRILGIESSSPSRSPAGAPSTRGPASLAENVPGRTPLSSGDLMGMAPDPTRRELNPVVARPAPTLGGDSPLSLTESSGALRARPAAVPRAVVDMSPMRMLPTASGSADLGALDSNRRTIYSPSSLEMPRRSF